MRPPGSPSDGNLLNFPALPTGCLEFGSLVFCLLAVLTAQIYPCCGPSWQPSSSNWSDDGDSSDDATSSFSISDLDDVSDHTACDPEVECRTYTIRRTGWVIFWGTPSEFSAFKTQSMVEAATGFMEEVEGVHDAFDSSEGSKPGI